VADLVDFMAGELGLVARVAEVECLLRLVGEVEQVLLDEDPLHVGRSDRENPTSRAAHGLINTRFLEIMNDPLFRLFGPPRVAVGEFQLAPYRRANARQRSLFGFK